ncbi:unnamed protein product [Arabis nemorensis]|uniref:MATH domain-containing protein n=1 Tax=Arabis nemorensis TaxID=586526 RepID=A0A565BPR9_9BRAS|nr:unnamed protein product [Arabis nemorensis]
MSNQKPSFRFEIDIFSKKESAIKSQTFLSGGCECVEEEAIAEAANNLFCAKTPGRVFATLPLSKLQEKGVLFTSLSKLFDEHPDIAKDFKLKNQVVKTEYMNVLLNLIETVEKPSKNQSHTELGKARSELSELMEVGFKLDWLKSKLEKGSLESLRSKLEEISLGKKKAEDADRSRGTPQES